MTGHVIRSGEYVIMVQDQDSLGGGFHPRDAFSEMMSDVNVWDHVLSPAVIMKCQNLVCLRRATCISGKISNLVLKGTLQLFRLLLVSLRVVRVGMIVFLLLPSKSIFLKTNQIFCWLKRNILFGFKS